MGRIHNRFTTDGFATGTIGDHNTGQLSGRIDQDIRHHTTIEKINLLIDQIIFQRLLHLQRSRTLFTTENLLCQWRLQRLTR